MKPAALSQSEEPSQTERLSVKPDSRIPALDGLRGIASLMVVAYHFGPHIVRADASSFRFLHDLPSLWFKGVDLFFVLSGFLISGILVNERHSPSYFRTFYARRAFRIFPLYYLVLLGYGIALLLHADPKWRLFEQPLPFWTYLLYLQNFAMAAAGGFGAIWMAGSWSLAVEEQFYFTLPAIIRWIGDRGLLRIALIAFAAAPIFRGLIQRFRLLPAYADYVLLPTTVDDLAVGVLVMLLLRHQRQWVLKHSRSIVWIAVGLFFAWSLYPYVPNPQAIRLAFLYRSVTAVVFGFVLLSLLLFPASGPARFLSTRPMRNLGNMAYSTYLFHPIMLCVAFMALRGKDPFLTTSADLTPIFVALPVTLALSWLSWTQFESRLLRIGHRFRY
jgi:peptidoglycan/LPS O-acetylase OafA/YrhL